jgi:alpha/beta superfamily hydrolase
MGSRMSLTYFTGTPDPAVKSWASLGPSFNGYAKLKLPILDLYGDNDLPPVLTNAAKRKQSLASKDSRQVVVARTDHFFTGHEGEMVTAVADFLNATLK